MLIDYFEQTIRPRIPKANLWSVAELCLTEAQVDALMDRFAALTESDWKALNRLSSTRNVSRLILIVAFSEFARRESVGARIWASIRKMRMHPSLRDHFFMPSGHARQELRQTIESGARHWKLRHVFDIPGHQAWFLTLNMQFGFSLETAKRRLPYWLSGQIHPIAAYYLRNDLRSSSFSQMWQSLSAYRKGVCTTEKCKQTLESSPWLLQEWIPKVLELAKSRLYLDAFTDDRDEDDIDPLILASPRLQWPADASPAFVCEVLAGSSYELTEDYYEIRDASSENEAKLQVIRIRKVSEDCYDASVDFLRLPTHRTEYRFELFAKSVEHGEREVFAQAIELWSEQEPISLFDAGTGSALQQAEEAKVLKQGCFAIYHETFEITPCADRCEDLGEWRLAHFDRAIDTSEIQLLEEGKPVWWIDPKPQKAKGASGSMLEAEPSLSYFPNRPIQQRSGEPPPHTALCIELPEGARLDRLRFGQGFLQFNQMGNSVLTSTFDLLPNFFVKPPVITLVYELDGEKRRWSKRLRLPMNTLILEDHEGLEFYDPDARLNVGEVGRYLFHFHFSQHDTDPLWILEGSQVIGKVRHRGVSLHQLAGYGESLQVVQQLFNCSAPPKVIIDRVVDQGVVRNFKLKDHFGRIRLTSELEMDSKHRLILWDAAAGFVIANPVKSGEDRTWTFEYPENTSQQTITAMGLFYDGCRIGSWFAREFWETQSVHPSRSCEELGELLRWFKAPLLYPTWRAYVTTLIENDMGELMTLWLSSDPSPILNLDPLPVEDSWLRVVGQLTSVIKPQTMSMNDASIMVETLHPSVDIRKMSKHLAPALYRLDGVGPNIIVGVAKNYLDALKQDRYGGNYHEAREKVIERFKVNEADFDEFCEKLKVDSFFLRRTLTKWVSASQSMEEHDRRNYSLLLNHRLVRRHITELLLSKI